MWKPTFARWFRREDLDMIVSNIGITPDFSAIYTSNSGQHTAFVQVSLKKEHPLGSYEYMRRVRTKLADDLPELSTYFQSGGLVDAVVNLGLPAPIDIQVSGNDQKQAYQTAAEIAAKDPPASWRERRTDSAGPRLSGAFSSISTAKWRGGWGCRPRKRWTT